MNTDNATLDPCIDPSPPPATLGLFAMLREDVACVFKRDPAARSTLDDLATGHFERIIPDASVDPPKARRVILCSGKVYYDLLKARTDRAIDDVALVRLEQLYPLRRDEIRGVLAPYPRATEVAWCQEEPWNMGAWYFVNARLRAMLDGRLSARCICRAESASPATGSKASHDLEQQQLIDEALT